MAPPRKPKGKSDKNPPPRSALDSEQRLLRERERQLKSQIDALQRSINEAGPGGAAGYRLRTTLTDPSTGQQATKAGQQPSREPRRPRRRVVLRAEKQAGRLHTLALLVAVVIVVIWAASRYF